MERRGGWPLRFPFQVEKREDVKRTREGVGTTHAINFFKKHKMPPSGILKLQCAQESPGQFAKNADSKVEV